MFGVKLDQPHLFVLTPRQAQVVDGHLVDGEHRGGGAELGRHVGDGRAVAQRQRGSAFSVELQVRTHHLFLAQELGQRQHGVGGSDAGLRFAREFHAHDVRQAHPRGAAQHHTLGLQPTHTDGDHTQRVHMRRVAVGADKGVGVGHAVFRMHHRAHPL